MRRLETIALVVALVLAAWATKPRAAGVIIWPNCASPGDTIVVKSGGWKDYGGSYQAMWTGVDWDDHGIYCLMDMGGTKMRLAVKLQDTAPFGAFDATVAPIICFDAEPICDDCDWVPAGTGPSYCWSGLFQIVADPGNPFEHEVTTKVWGSDSVKVMTIRFLPERTCNTSPCSAVRFIQAVKPLVSIGGGTPAYVPRSALLYEPLRYWQEMDAYAVDGWNTDFLGDSFISDGLGGWDSQGNGDPDPYYNGNAVWELDNISRGKMRVGCLGIPCGSSIMYDFPGTNDQHYRQVGATAMSKLFEVNAFCSEGANQGEWIGRMKWRWSRAYGEQAVIDDIVFEPKAKPSAEFMAALQLFCQRRPFDFPDVTFPTDGGVSCPGGRDPVSHEGAEWITKGAGR